MTERVDVLIGIRSLIDQLRSATQPIKLRPLLNAEFEKIHYLITRTDPFL